MLAKALLGAQSIAQHGLDTGLHVSPEKAKIR
jgi:hypothetical protein